MNQEKVRIKFRLNEEENDKLIYCSKLCGLTQSEFIRQLCRGKTPQIRQTKAFWKLINALYELHESFKKCIPYYPETENECKNIEALILQLQEV